MSLRLTLRMQLGRILTSPRLRSFLRNLRETRRTLTAQPHRVHCFLQIDDPYSCLLVQRLEEFAARYRVAWQFHLVPAPPDWAMPERERAEQWALRDAREQALARGLWFPEHCPPTSPSRVQQGQKQLLAAFSQGVPAMQDAFRQFWSEEPLSLTTSISEKELQVHLQHSEQVRQSRGHYLSATLWYEGEWYWGLDRLAFLEERLLSLGLSNSPDATLLCPRREVELLSKGEIQPLIPELECFLSLRSPYSYLALERIFALAEHYGVRLKIRMVLPMVMRGLPVPWAKRKYLVQDSKREAERLGLPFGTICDPLGAGVERGLALVYMAKKHDRQKEFLLSFARGVWTEGINAATDKGLRTLVERAGLDWNEARKALQEEEWRAEAEDNRKALLDMGLWGVPSVRFGEWSTWGQDRLWLVEQQLLACQKETS